MIATAPKRSTISDQQTRQDLDALNDLTDLLAPPAWLQSMQLTRTSVSITGEADQAAPLIKLLDGSRHFQGSSFSLPLQKSGGAELFSIRSSRKGVTHDDFRSRPPRADYPGRRAVVLGGLYLLVFQFLVLVEQRYGENRRSRGQCRSREKRLAILRKQAATLPGKEAVLKQVSTELAQREKGLIPGDTAEQAQAQLLEIVKRVAQQQTPPLEVGQVEFGRPRTFGYGVWTGERVHHHHLPHRRAGRIFSPPLSAQPELAATEEIRFGTSHPKQKTMPIRLTVTGLVARRLVPAAEGFAANYDAAKLRTLDLALLVIAGLLYWQLRREWIGSHARDLALLHQRASCRLACPGLRRSTRWPRSPRPTSPTSP